MYKFTTTLLILLCLNNIFAQSSLVLDKNTTPEYPELIKAYKQLDNQYTNAKLLTYGTTDFGLPLKLLVISNTQTFDPIKAKQEKHN